MLNHRLSSFPARPSSRGGFTLIELLVVIAIIGVLASVTVPAVMGGLARANQNKGMQNARSIGLLMFQFSMDNNGSYPPTSGTTSTAAFSQLIVGSYVNSADIFWITGNPAKPAAYAQTPASGLTSTCVSWDVMGETAQGASTATGVNQQDPDQLPIVFTDGTTISGITSGTATPATCGAANPFKDQGIPVCYHGNNCAFMKVDTAPATISKFVPASIIVPTGVTYSPMSP